MKTIALLFLLLTTACLDDACIDACDDEGWHYGRAIDGLCTCSKNDTLRHIIETRKTAEEE